MCLGLLVTVPLNRRRSCLGAPVLPPAGDDLADRVHRQLGRSISEQQAVRLLVCIGELRVAEAREEWEGADNSQELYVLGGQVLDIA